MKITSKMKVGEVMRNYPSTVNLFLRYGICNCCGVENTIEKIAGANEIDLEKLLDELNKQVS